MPSVCQDLRRRYDEATTDEVRETIRQQMVTANCDTSDLPASGGHGNPPPPPGGAG